jgi:two-component system response regulator AtoC
LILLVVTPHGVAEHRLPSEGRLTIGRGTENAIRIDDRSVSRRHAVLDVGETLRIEDLGGANGTYIQRMRSTFSAGQTEDLRALRRDALAIELGDRVVIGAAQLVVRRARATSDAPWDATYVVADRRMIDLYALVDRAASSRVSVLFHGETGAGKDVVAQRLHLRSPRKDGPFVAINCAALPESLVESELFGTEKGSFTGAPVRPGLFETAERGTLFLDEIGELALPTQAKLLRVLDERKVTRLGGRTPREVDVRFVAATNRDLKRAVEQGAFRADLYFRVAAMSLHIPPLRERPADIEPLARLLLERACRDLERPLLELAEDAVLSLMRYPWPGNVRELKNAMDQGAVMCTGPRVELEHLPETIYPPPRGAPPSDSTTAARAARSTAPPQPSNPRLLKDDLRILEKERILQALERNNYNQTRTAVELGIPRRTLINRLDEYDVGRPRKR